MGQVVPRLYEQVIRDHFQTRRQMLFLSGPRQVGKTTLARAALAERGAGAYLSWDDVSDRRVMLAGTEAIAERVGLDQLREQKPLLVLDELRKHAGWKDLLKGLFDSRGDELDVLVTGSARLDVFRTGGDSLVGRYLSYRVHPLSVGELARPWVGLTRPPVALDSEDLEALERFSGFPEPYLLRDERFHRQWRRLRSQQLLREDLRDLTRIHEVSLVETLVELLRHRAGQLTTAASLARDLRVSQDTVRRWLDALSGLYVAFRIRPWSRNVRRALKKEPKVFLWDWSLVEDPGARWENLVACHLLKAVHLWSDHGLGDFGLHFVRDKQQREVDFLVSRDGEPWVLVEVKRSDTRLAPSLRYFQEETGAPIAVQCVRGLGFVGRDGLVAGPPMVVSGLTVLGGVV